MSRLPSLGGTAILAAMGLRGGHNGGEHGHADWSLQDLKRPTQLMVAVVALLVSGAITQPVACNFHELSHVIVGTALGWEVEQVHWCLPTAGEVQYADMDTAVGHLQGYAGGLFAAALVVGVYWLVMVRERRPLQHPAWWAAGLGMLPFAGGEFFIGVLEGVAGPPEWDYTQMINDHPLVWVPLIVASMLAAATYHVWRWRAVWRPG